tara:strand:+ start:3213 stop:4085 length:873 start_codon:yes stop_codon:yes gene_type:complete
MANAHQFTAPQTPAWLQNHLRSFATPRDAAQGLLFHGTVEPFTTPLKATGWEGLLWFAEAPEIAQSYCPESGSEVLKSFLRYALDERFIPHGDFDEKLFAHMGYDIKLMDAERDNTGRMVSYRILEGHPTNREVKRHLEDLGYTFDDESAWIKVRLKSEGGDEIMPAAWKIPGRLYILERDPDLRLYDLQSSAEGGLTGRQWMRTDIFEKLAATGQWDGIIIDDIHQSNKMGHFGHRSIGLFQKAIDRLKSHVIPCVNAEPWDIWQARDSRTTEEFDSLFHGVGQMRRAA